MRVDSILVNFKKLTNFYLNTQGSPDAENLQRLASDVLEIIDNSDGTTYLSLMHRNTRDVYPMTIDYFMRPDEVKQAFDFVFFILDYLELNCTLDDIVLEKYIEIVKSAYVLYDQVSHFFDPNVVVAKRLVLRLKRLQKLRHDLMYH